MRNKRTYAPAPRQSMSSSYGLPSARSVLTEVAKEAGKIAMRKLTNTKPKARTAGVSGSKTIRVNAGSNFRKSKGKRKVVNKPKKTLAKRVKALEKTKGPKSIYEKHYSILLYMPHSAGERAVFWLEANNHPEVESVVSNILIPGGSADLNLTTLNTKYRVEFFSKLTLKNGSIYGQHVKYVTCECADNTAQSPLFEYRAWLLDRGLIVANGINNPTATTTNRAFVPQHIIHPKAEMHYDYLSSGYNQRSSSWKKSGNVGVNTLYLQPGESVDLYLSSDFMYAPENADLHGSGIYLKDAKSNGFLISVVGELGHGTGANVDEMGRLQGQIDACFLKKYVVSYDNGAGVHKIAWEDEFSVQTTATAFEVAGVEIVEQ